MAKLLENFLWLQGDEPLYSMLGVLDVTIFKGYHFCLLAWGKLHLFTGDEPLYSMLGVLDLSLFKGYHFCLLAWYHLTVAFRVCAALIYVCLQCKYFLYCYCSIEIGRKVNWLWQMIKDLAQNIIFALATYRNICMQYLLRYKLQRNTCCIKALNV
ncbi:hypothetical protein R6Q59_003791 [Mikania micrantha]